MTTGAGLRDLTRHGTFVEALTELHGSVADGAIVLGPGGHSVAPSALAHDATLVWNGAATAPRQATREVVLTRLPLGTDTLVASRVQLPDAADTATEPYGTWLRALARVRLATSSALLDTCLDYLGARQAGDTSLLRKQMVEGTIADCLTEHLEIGAVLDEEAAVPGEENRDGMLPALHAQITETDRCLLRLLGASGFLADGPGQTAHASALLADVYAPAEGGDDD